MKALQICLILFVFVSCLRAQTASSKSKTAYGLEIDVLPYITGGWFGAVWVGKNHWRIRTLVTKVYKPDWFTKKGFSNHSIQSYAVVGDQFLQKDWKNWWLGGGLVFWKSNIQTSDHLYNGSFSNFLLNGSIGWHWKFHEHFYLSPWAGMSVRISGSDGIGLGNENFVLPLFNPEASLKIGFIY